MRPEPVRRHHRIEGVPPEPAGCIVEVGRQGDFELGGAQQRGKRLSEVHEQNLGSHAFVASKSSASRMSHVLPLNSKT
jgi:hypothetical protein